MRSMFGKIITTVAMAIAMLLSSNLEAQRDTVVVKRNGVTVLKTMRVAPRCETQKRARVHNRHGCKRPSVRIRDQRHFNRVKGRRNHKAHRCTTCIRYQRWLNWKPTRYDPVIHVCR